jgi:hypothetical protein
MLRGKVAAVAAALLCTPLLGCSDPKNDARELNVRLNFVDDQLNDAVKEFSTHLAGALAGDKDVVLALRKAYKKMKETLVKMKLEMEAVKVPPAPTARKFYDAVSNRVANFEKRLDDYSAIIRTVEDQSLSPEDKKEKVLSVAKRIDRGEAADGAAIHSAQEAFAREYNFTLLKR